MSLLVVAVCCRIYFVLTLANDVANRARMCCTAENVSGDKCVLRKEEPVALFTLVSFIVLCNNVNVVVVPCAACILCYAVCLLC